MSTQGDLSTITKTIESHETIVAEMLEDRELVQPCMSNGMTRQVMAGPLLSMHGSMKSNEHLCSLNKGFSIILCVTASMYMIYEIMIVKYTYLIILNCFFVTNLCLFFYISYFLIIN